MSGQSGYSDAVRLRVAEISVGRGSVDLTLCDVSPLERGSEKGGVASRSLTLTGHVTTVVRYSQEDHRVSELTRLLDAGEVARSCRFVKAIDRTRYLVAHAMLRKVLAERLAVNPERLEILRSPSGKPVLAPPYAHLKFNLSHSRRHVAIAIADRAVGVDVEEVSDEFDFESLAMRFFSRAEQHYVTCGDRTGLPQRFYRVWVRKEAALKASGVGLAGISGTDVLGETVVQPGPEEDKRTFLVSDGLYGANIAIALAVEMEPRVSL